MDKWFYFVVTILLTYNSEATQIEISTRTWFKKRQFPFFAYIDIPALSGRSQSKEDGCGATLIDPQWILTAAHCFPRDKKTLARLQEKQLCKVYAGSRKDVTNSIKTIYLHPQYVDKETPEGVVNVLLNDIAVAKLKTKYELNQHLTIITLPPIRFSTETKSGCKVGTIVGREDANSPVHYKEEIVSTNVESVLPSSTVFFSETTDQMEESFEGYFGGPYICYQLFYNKHVPCQYGVVSYVEYNAEKEKTIIVYEEVMQHLNFIYQHVAETKNDVQFTRMHNVTDRFKMADMDENVYLKSADIDISTISVSSREVGPDLVLAVSIIMYFKVK